MKLSDLVGFRKLDAVDFSNESIEGGCDRFEDCQVCRFRLDGVTYMAIEDPEDGYRSCMRTLIINKDSKMKNTFQSIFVSCTYSGESRDTLQLRDIKTGKVVLEVGTDDTEEYYPYFVAYFNPENMCLNSLKEVSNDNSKEAF